MSLIDEVKREIHFKIVYYGPGLCGKTTNIQYMFDRYPMAERDKLISLATETDRTLFFNFRPQGQAPLDGLTVRVHLYTVPGPTFYDSSRVLILKGADGAVFVADSQSTRREANLKSLDELETNLAVHGIDAATFPIVLQCNKRDLPEVMPIAQMDADLNPDGRERLEAVAFKGQGVFDTFERVWGMMRSRERRG